MSTSTDALFGDTEDIPIPPRPKTDRGTITIIDAPGVFREISKMRLKIDERYQREADRKKVVRIAAQWSWSGCGAIIVVYRDGEFWVIDGQHRVLAAMRHPGIDRLPCMVYKFETLSEEAKAFLRNNTERKPIHASQRFNAKIVAGDAASDIVRQLIATSGRVPSRNGGPNTVTCITTLTEWARKSPDELFRVWPIIVDLTHGYLLHQRIVDAMVYLECRMPGGDSLTSKRWNQRIIETGYDRILSEINRVSSIFAKGSHKIYAHGLLNAINYKLRYPLIIPGINDDRY